MDKPKLKYRFHNPNPTDEELIRVLLRTCIDANRKKAEETIRECAMSDGETYSVIAVENGARIADMGERTLFKMPNGSYEGKSYFIPNEYIKKDRHEYVLELPQDFEIELRGGEIKSLTLDEFVKAVADRTAEDYESQYMRPNEIAAHSRGESRPKRRASSRQKVNKF